VNYLLGTNIISEVRKGEQCDPNVAAWYASIDDADVYLSVLVLGEIRNGIERVSISDPSRSRRLENWLSSLLRMFGERVLPVNQLVADEWGRMSAKRSAPPIDALLAATAKAHRMTFATRNASDIAGLGADVLNPFEPVPKRRP
jgi:toxin FitB